MAWAIALDKEVVIAFLEALAEHKPMVTLAIALLIAPVAATEPPRTINACKWVHGRFDVWNGSSVRRIWVIGTHHLLALRDEDDSAPRVLQKYVYAGPHLGKANGLFGNFRVCALEPSRAGHMQHVRVLAADHLVFQGKPFQPDS